jgi:hypothetical protein
MNFLNEKFSWRRMHASKNDATDSTPFLPGHRGIGAEEQGVGRGFGAVRRRGGDPQPRVGPQTQRRRQSLQHHQVHGRMARGGFGLSEVSLGPA